MEGTWDLYAAFLKVVLQFEAVLPTDLLLKEFYYVYLENVCNASVTELSQCLL